MQNLGLGIREKIAEAGLLQGPPPSASPRLSPHWLSAGAGGCSGSSAKTLAESTASSAVGCPRSRPICVDQFQRGADAPP